MQTARRLYVYLLSGISLGVLVAGVSMLLTVLLQSVGLSFGGPQLGGGDVRVPTSSAAHRFGGCTSPAPWGSC